MRDGLRLDDMLASLKAMEAAEQISVYVYKRVLERYPQASAFAHVVRGCLCGCHCSGLGGCAGFLGLFTPLPVLSCEQELLCPLHISTAQLRTQLPAPSSSDGH